jgi:hypothetical protein
MGGGDFDSFLVRFAEQVEKCRHPNALVDAVQFKMDMAKMEMAKMEMAKMEMAKMEMAKMEMGWRDDHIIPRYNAAGLAKFAFVMPRGMPAIGAPPANEGPQSFRPSTSADGPMRCSGSGYSRPKCPAKSNRCATAMRRAIRQFQSEVRQ